MKQLKEMKYYREDGGGTSMLGVSWQILEPCNE
jgi:hypothetical protein